MQSYTYGDHYTLLCLIILMRDLIRKGKEILFQSTSVYFLPSFQFNITTVLLHCVWNFDSRFISPVTVSVYHSQIINTDVTDVLILTVKSRECQSTAMHCNEKKSTKTFRHSCKYKFKIVLCTSTTRLSTLKWRQFI